MPATLPRFLALALSALALACSSTGGGGGGTRGSGAPPTRVVMSDLRTGDEFAVVNDGALVEMGVEGESAEERRASFYSQQRAGTKPKVASDALMANIVEFLRHNDFERYAFDGAAPRRGGEATQTLELVVDGQARHLRAFRGMDAARGQAFRESVRGFLLTYNEIPQLQTVEGDFRFDGIQVPATRQKR